ncbi:replication initiator protein A [Methylophaga thalassica]|nr:replication initiator protein A [Methylophaga thalassica]
MAKDQLKRLKHPQKDLFVIDALDVIIKDDMPSMEYPFYSLSKKPDREVRRYEYKDRWIEFRPSIKGLPTIYDKDLIIYAISNIIAALDEGQEPPKEVEIDPYAFFVFTQRGTGGRDYDALRDSLDRLDGTRFRTNITMNGTIIDQWQGLLDKSALKTNEATGKPEVLRITLSDMVINTIKSREVLTLNRDYFRLKKPIERRIYELARKHVGQQNGWGVSLETLHIKSGSRAVIREFRRAVKHLSEHNHLPDYHVYFEKETDKVFFYPREEFQKAYKPNEQEEAEGETLPALAFWAIEKGKAAAPDMDIYALEADWRALWKKTGKKPFENHNAAFIGYCKSAYKKANS